MAEVFAGLQTADAIAGLSRVVIKVVDYCKRLRAAREVAKEVLERIEHWDETLDTISGILQARTQHPIRRLSPVGSVKFEKNVKTAANRCVGTLTKIDVALGRFGDANIQDDKINLSDRRDFVTNEPHIRNLLAALDSHQATLKMALDILRWHDDISDRLEQFTSRPSAISEIATDATRVESQDDMVCMNDAVDSLQSMQQIARHLQNEGESGSVQMQQAIDWPRPTRSMSTASTAVDANLSERIEAPGRRDSVHSLSPHDRETLDLIIHKHYDRGKKYFEKAKQDKDNEESRSYDKSREHLERAIFYSKQRETVYGVVYGDRVLMHVKLARVYQELRQWQRALDIVEMEIPEVACELPRPDALELQPAYRAYLVSSTRFHRYLSDESRATRVDDIRLADAHAKRVLELLGADVDLCPEQVDLRQACLKILVNLYRDQGDDVAAEIYFEMLEGRTQGSERTQLHDDLPLVNALRRHEIDAATAIRQACEKSDRASLESLISRHGVDIDTADERGTTALHYVASVGDGTMAKFLLEKRADINAIDTNGHTALSKAVMHNHAAVVEILLRWRDGKVVATTRHDKRGTLLHEAIKHENARCSTLILRHAPALLNEEDRNGKTALHWAVERGYLGQAALLLRSGIDRNKPDRSTSRRTPLSMALEGSGNEAMFKVLFNAGAIIGDAILTDMQKAKLRTFLPAVAETVHRRATTAGYYEHFDLRPQPHEATRAARAAASRRATLT